MAWAEDGEGAAPGGGAGTSQESSNTAQDPGAAVQDPPPAGVPSSDSVPDEGPQPLSSADADAEEAPGSAVTVDLGGGVVVSSSGGSLPDEEDIDEDEDVAPPAEDEGDEVDGLETAIEQPKPLQDNDSYASAAPNEPEVADVDTRGDHRRIPAGPAAPSAETTPQPEVEQFVAVVTTDQSVVETASAPAVGRAEPTSEFTTVLTTLFSPFATDDPEAPVENPLVWVLAAAARREVGTGLQTEEAATFGITGDVNASLMAAATNSVPTATLTSQKPPTSTGTVTGKVTAADPDGDKLTYSALTTPKGTVTVTSTGSFTYTPTAVARHAAAAADADPAAKTDTFTIRVDDGRGGTADVDVNVSIVPANSAPTTTTPTVGKPDPVSGLVTGRSPPSTRTATL